MTALSAPLRFLATAALLGAAACGGGGGGGSGPAFRLVSTTPTNGAQSVPQDAHVVVRFSLPIDAATFTQTALQVGVATVGLEPGVLTMTAPDTIEYVPAGVLEGGSPTAVLVSGLLRSTAGDPLGGTLSFTFLTAGLPGSGIVLPLPTALHSTAGRLYQGRRNHTATLLQNGRVLLCGGFIGGTTVTNTAETFDPNTQFFTLVPGAMRHPRASHTATLLLDGRVLLTGGQYEAGVGTLNADRTAEIFDPTTNTFTDALNLGAQRFDHAARRLPNGSVVVTGGSQWAGGNIVDLASVEVFSPSTGLWAPWPVPMAHTHATHGMVDLEDGRWLVAGGSAGDLRPEIFDVALGTFTGFSAPPSDGTRFGAAVETFSDGDVIVAGGGLLGSVLYFDRPATLMIDSGSGLAAPRAYGTATRIADDRILVVGGIDQTPSGLILASCDLVVQGGVAGSRTFETLVRFPTGMAFHTATVLQDGRILFAGGLAPFGLPELDGAYLFTP